MSLNANAIMDATYFNQMWQGEELTVDRIEHFINAVSTAFEKFCNRFLIERSYTFDDDDLIDEESEPIKGIYNIPEYTIFDAPPQTSFWFPTYPVSSVSLFQISGTEISSATDFLGDNGYILYNRTGKLVYSYGFDYPYLQNVKVKWIGGYSSSSIEMSHIRYLCFLSIKDIINSPQNMTYESEKIGQYSYKTIPTYFLKSLQGLSPKVFSDLKSYRKESIG